MDPRESDGDSRSCVESSVILSGPVTKRSEVRAQSKDPVYLALATAQAGNSLFASSLASTEIH
jgi:hypothetical protein